MSRTAEAFRHGKALIAFLTAGDPSLEDSVRYVKRLVEGGADLVEIGVPFSDPIADGPVIMDADVRALNNHVHLPQVLEEVIAIRKEGVNVPIVLLTYYNPVFNYGVDAFFASCERIGIDGVIIPDLPFEEQGEVRPAADEHGVDIIQMVAPTSEDRIRRNVKNATGFVYVVSSMGVTGMRSEIETDLDHMMKIIRETTDVPAAIGFGIHTPEQARAMAEKADGVITGSGVVNIIGEHGDKADEALKEYVSSLKEAIRF
jgi:tryptophan synthase alpha chain